jgi:hypothetical protein
MQPYIPQSLPLTTIDFGRLIRLVGDANDALARFDGLLYGTVNAELLLSPLTTNEAVLSSRIEGTQATLNDVLEFEAGVEKPASLRDDIQEAGYLLCSSCLFLYFCGFPMVSVERIGLRDRLRRNGLFQKATKQLTTTGRCATIETEREFFQIRLKMFHRKGSLMCTKQPTFQ